MNAHNGIHDALVACRQRNKNLVFPVTSDIHVLADGNVRVRHVGDLIRTDFVANQEDVEDFLQDVFSDVHWEWLWQRGSADVGMFDESFGRVRVHAMYVFEEGHRGELDLRGKAPRVAPRVELRLRLLSDEPPPFDALGLPDVVLDMAHRPSGLLVFVGETGSGKTTALASLGQHRLHREKISVATIEEAVEFRMLHGEGAVSHRQVGRETASYAEGVRSLMREDIDLAIVSETRDAACAAALFNVSESGCLTGTTTHAGDCVQTITRLISYFPSEHQHLAQMQLGNSLVGIVVMRLLPRKDGDGRVLAYEILCADEGIKNNIRDGQFDSIRMAMQSKGAKSGNVTFEQSLARLCRQRIITQEVANANTRRPDDLVTALGA